MWYEYVGASVNYRDKCRLYVVAIPVSLSLVCSLSLSLVCVCLSLSFPLSLSYLFRSSRKWLIRFDFDVFYD